MCVARNLYHHISLSVKVDLFLVRNIVIVRVYICIVVYVNPDESTVFK